MPNDTELKQNLIDAGCDDEFIVRFIAIEHDRRDEMLAMLARQRRALLGCVHAIERKIYCLDYLVTKLKNKNQSEE